MSNLRIVTRPYGPLDSIYTFVMNQGNQYLHRLSESIYFWQKLPGNGFVNPESAKDYLVKVGLVSETELESILVVDERT